jgi:hypothetical protein
VYKDRQILELRRSEALPQLAERLRCQTDDVFDALGKHISTLFQNNSLPVFTRDHLKLVVKPQCHDILATAITCAPKDALIHLFDPAAVAITMRHVDPHAQLPIDANTLEFALRSPRMIASLEITHGAGFNDWGAIIQDEAWLRPEAMDGLRAYARRLGWPHDDVTRILAAVVAPSESWGLQIVEEGQYFGALAMVWLHQRIMHTILLLREEAIRLAREAAGWLPAHTAVANLAPWIELYERGAILRALPYMVAGKRPLGCFLAKDAFTDKIVVGHPEPNQTFIVADQEIYLLSKINIFANQEARKRGRFSVLCKLKGEESPRVIFQCKGLRISTYEHLVRQVATLEVNDLSPVGKTLAERLLNTPILIPDPFLDQIAHAVKALGPTFVQCMILSQSPCSIEMNAPWNQELQGQLPYTVTPVYENESSFKFGIREIRDKMLREGRPNTRLVTE